VSTGALVFSSGRTAVTGASGRESRESCKEWRLLRFGREINAHLSSELEAYHVGNFVKMNNR
jgi:TATA-box binding protein (TBP) (component of TFIID and TFIIIB)